MSDKVDEQLMREADIYTLAIEILKNLVSRALWETSPPETAFRIAERLVLIAEERRNYILEGK